MRNKPQKRNVTILVCFLALLALVIVTRGQLFSISAHLVRQAISPELTNTAMARSAPAGLDADFIFQSNSSDRAIALLAVGDIASCAATTKFGNIGDDLLFSAGLGSDMTAKGAGHIRTEKLVRQYHALPILALGDLVYDSGSPAEFQHCYHPSWGRHKARTFPTPGNHEYKSLGALGYFNYWGARAGPNRRGYYSIRFGDWLVLSLNSEVGVHEGSSQFDWINATLADNRSDCVLAFYHSPAFSSRHRKNSDGVKPLFKLLESLGVTAVLNGHNHFYERTKPLDGTGAPALEDGMRTFIVGTGGKVRKRRERPAPISDKMITEENGVLKLELREGSFDWQFIAAMGQRVLDAGTAPCRRRS